MRVDGVEREIQSGRRFHHFGARSFKLSAHFFMLRLGGVEIRGMVKPKLTPTSRSLRLIPAGEQTSTHSSFPTMEWPLKRRKIVSGASFVTILSRVIALKLQVQAEAELALRRDRAVAAIGGHGLHLGSLACPARHAYTPVLVRLLRN